MTHVELIPCYQDNYSYLLTQGDKALIIDACEAQPIFKKLGDKKLKSILSTHHHQDHIAGNQELYQKTKCDIYGFEKDNFFKTQPLKANQNFEVLGFQFQMIAVPGHTMNSVAYILNGGEAVFSGDTLFSLGCGRLFEGSFEQMALSLQQFLKLPDDCRLYCGHEYTRSNLKFLKHLDFPQPDLPLSGPTIPSTIGFETEWNPFLRASNNVEDFKRLRILKDQFHG